MGLPRLVKDLLEGWSCSYGPLCLIWALWRERNMIVFNDECFSMTRLKASFISMFAS